MAERRPRLRIITGKGGVGKTTVATAMAMAEAQAGRRVLLAEAHGGDRVTALLGARGVGSDCREVRENLFVVDMNPQDAIREYAMIVLHFETVYKAVFGNRLVRYFIGLVPSLGELTMLGKIWYHDQEKLEERPRFDLIVLDAPSTGHAISMLRSPAAVAQTVPPGPMRDNCNLIVDMLTDRELTRMHIVVTPEEMPVNEAVMLEQAAKEVLHIELGTTLINARVPKLPPGTLQRLAALAEEPALAPAYRALKIREGKVNAGDGHLARLPAHMLEGALSLPRFTGATFGEAELTELAAVMAEAQP